MSQPSHDDEAVQFPSLSPAMRNVFLIWTGLAVLAFVNPWEVKYLQPLGPLLIAAMLIWPKYFRQWAAAKQIEEDRQTDCFPQMHEWLPIPVGNFAMLVLGTLILLFLIAVGLRSGSPTFTLVCTGGILSTWVFYYAIGLIEARRFADGNPPGWGDATLRRTIRTPRTRLWHLALRHHHCHPPTIAGANRP